MRSTSTGSTGTSRLVPQLVLLQDWGQRTSRSSCGSGGRNDHKFHNDQRQHGKLGFSNRRPLVAKGRGEADGSAVDMNYFLGFNVVSGAYTLAADFEEGAGQTQPGRNHALISSTTILDNTWYHAAATYDSATGTLALYLNGALEYVPCRRFGRAPQFNSTQHASGCQALPSTQVELLKASSKAIP